MPIAPEYQAMFAALADAGPSTAVFHMTPSDAREYYRASRAVDPQLPVHRIQDLSIPGPAQDIPVRIYQPESDGPFGIIVYFHGGGWVIGDLDTGDSVSRQLATLANVVVVAVDYRLAPEHIFPAAVEDCYAAVCWVGEHTAQFNGNGKIGLLGESAGGTLATVCAMLARDDSNGPDIAFQCLFYPVAEASMSEPSWTENASGLLLETDTMIWFWDHYCPDAASRNDPRTAPIHAQDHSNLPPALIVTAEFDPLRDEGERYAEVLKNAGNEVETMRCDGILHDFLALAAVFDCARKPFLASIKRIKTYLS